MDLAPEDALAAAVAAGLLDVHTSMPASVVSYNEGTGRAVVRPCGKRALLADDDGVASEQLPDLPNVIVAWPGGGGFVLRFPLNAGDSGWLHFSEVDASGWERDGKPGALSSTERHGLGSPIFYPLARVPPAGGGNVATPTPFVVGKAANAVAVACAPTVDARLQALETFATNQGTFNTTHFHPASPSPTGPSATPAPTPPSPGQSTASKNLKAEPGP
jgi:hypothetical protein